MTTVHQILKQINNFFDADTLAELMKSYDVIKRKRELEPSALLKALLKNSLKSEVSISDIVESLYEDDKINVSKPAMYKKLLKCEDFFIELLTRLLNKRTTSKKNYRKFKDLNDIVILDGISINKTKKIQVLYSNFNQKIINIDIEGSQKNDQSYKRHLDYMLPNQLLVADLGYFCVDSFRKIKEKGAFFLSRYIKTTSLWQSKQSKIDLNKFLLQQEKNEIDIPILIGSSKLSCRLICIRLNPKDKLKRARNIAKKRFKDRRLKRINHEWDGWNIFVTNLPNIKYTASLCYEIYASRWQIELLFKSMKSKCLQINNANYITALGKIMFYCKLIIAVLIFTLRGQKRIDISIAKLFKVSCRILINNIHRIGSWRLSFIRKIQKSIERFCITSMHKSRLSSYAKVNSYA
jgi:hypothetical protein